MRLDSSERERLEADLARCVHCGLCLQHCPTFVLTGLETESPRGRIAIVRAVESGRVEPTAATLGHLDRCLACRACEAACPSSVAFGRIIETVRAGLLPARRRDDRSLDRRSHALRTVLTHPRLLRWAFAGLRAYQASGAQTALRRSGVLRRVSRRLAEVEAQAPRLGSAPFSMPALPPLPAPRARVALLTGCVMPYLYPTTHDALVRVLRRNNVEVVAPRSQACCGALLAHQGDREAARVLAKRNVRAFLAAGVDAVLVDAAGCGSAMKEYGELLRGDRDAARLAAMVRDATEYLAALPVEPPKRPLRLRVTYQDSCHLAHAQRIRQAPRDLVRIIPGVELHEMAHPDLCCGSAGVYNLVEPEMSARLLERRMEEVREAGPEVVLTANPGCMLQLENGLRARRRPARVMHVVELLDWAYREEGGPVSSGRA